MSETSARLLALLSLLQARRDWPGALLAERLEVSPRTVRRDVDRLRDLGYPVRASKGPTVSTPAPTCRRCCSTTTRRSPSRSPCRRRPPR
jgi:biotin operon repressor